MLRRQSQILTIALVTIPLLFAQGCRKTVKMAPTDMLEIRLEVRGYQTSSGEYFDLPGETPRVLLFDNIKAEPVLEYIEETDDPSETQGTVVGSQVQNTCFGKDPRTNTSIVEDFQAEMNAKYPQYKPNLDRLVTEGITNNPNAGKNLVVTCRGYYKNASPGFKLPSFSENTAAQ
ncbi:MAG: hypothetical protein ACRCXZ_01265 [Patescibacteria group bacterium]